jgi:hypothetical protein
MSGAKRTVLRRGRRFGADAMALFVALDRDPRARKPFSAGSRKLAGLVGLECEWLTGNSVLDRRRGPHRAPGCCAYEDWITCRAVRKELLLAAARSRAG